MQTRRAFVTINYIEVILIIVKLNSWQILLAHSLVIRGWANVFHFLKPQHFSSKTKWTNKKNNDMCITLFMSPSVKHCEKFVRCTPHATIQHMTTKYNNKKQRESNLFHCFLSIFIARGFNTSHVDPNILMFISSMNFVVVFFVVVVKFECFDYQFDICQCFVSFGKKKTEK